MSCRVVCDRCRAVRAGEASSSENRVTSFVAGRGFHGPLFKAVGVACRLSSFVRSDWIRYFS
eukprot:334132-Prymnesium_polylepis.1